jgi:hypothetical protein
LHLSVIALRVRGLGKPSRQRVVDDCPKQRLHLILHLLELDKQKRQMK